MWKEGTIIVNGVICHYCLKRFEECSEYGIDDGRISKLTIKADGKITCNYDRGWDIEPTDKITEQAFAILMHRYN